MSPQTVNLLYSIVLIIGVVALSAYQVFQVVFKQTSDPNISAMIVALLGLLMGYRHAADIKNDVPTAGTNGKTKE